MTKNGIITKENEKGSRVRRVVILLFSVIIATVISFLVVIITLGKSEAMLLFIREHLVISLSGGCAFYVLLFMLIIRAVEKFLNNDV